MSKVLIRKANYDYGELKPVVFEIMDSCIGEMISAGSRVIIKPNLLAAAPPDKAIVTHPMMVRAVAEYVIHRGARPRISDSPAVGKFEKILKESGIKDVLEDLDVEFREFKQSVTIDTGKPFRQLEVAEDVMKADVIINLPKLKTHTQMLLTLGVKNLFGCIVGMKKPEWHMRAGADRELFARLLVRIFRTVRPTVTVLDGILAMEGQGPGRAGVPKEVSVVMGSTDTVAVDMTVCRMLGLEADELMTTKIALEEEIADRNIELDGTLPSIGDFILPQMTSPMFGPVRFHRFIRKHLTQRPVCDDSLCKHCGECWKYCPAQAISHSRKKLHFDYDTCIRCYCCIEVCPHAALQARETVMGKVTRKVLKI
ncbi:MAG: hypothetical protein AMK70_14445 [Nitrospira bacterium SG8_35_1]|nr:MAG: hypothetical protein AMK70_14445 [Nitrospira bacterium SG8_35_1]